MEYTCIRKCYFMNQLILEGQEITVTDPSDNDKKMLERCFEGEVPVKKKAPKKSAPKLPESKAPGFLE